MRKEHPITVTSGVEIPIDKVAEICRRYHVTEMSVFGSAARGGMHQGSDIDIMVVLDPNAKLGWRFFGIAEELSELLGRPVDLGTKDSLKPHAKPSALQDAIVIYAAR